MDDMQRELSVLKHILAQLERGDPYKQWAGPHADALAVVKAGYRRKIAGLNQRLAQISASSQINERAGSRLKRANGQWLRGPSQNIPDLAS